jgi:hypothetical protein
VNQSATHMNRIKKKTFGSPNGSFIAMNRRVSSSQEHELQHRYFPTSAQSRRVREKDKRENEELLRMERKNDLIIFEGILRTKLIESIRIGQKYELLLITLVFVLIISLYLFLFTHFAHSKHLLILSILLIVSFFLSGFYAHIKKPRMLLNQMNQVLRIFHVRFNVAKMKLVRLKSKQNTQPLPNSPEEISTSFNSGIPGILK